MVDQKARRKYAELVRQFISGRMTNDEYEDRYEAIQQNKSDTAIGEIYHQLWFLYDDIQTHKMTGTHRLDREGRKTVAKTILFLQSDNEYQWPKDSMLGISLILWLVLIGVVSSILMSLMPRHLLLIVAAALVIGISFIALCGLRSVAENRRWKRHGDTEAWPFLRQADLAEAVRHPRLLNGKKAMP